MNWDEQHPAYKEDLGRRILSVIERASTKKAVAEAAGVTVEQLNKWCGLSSGGSIPKVPVSALLGISNAVGVDFAWLATGVSAGERTHDTESIGEKPILHVPRYDIALSAGAGSFVERAERVEDIPFPPGFFEKRLRRKPDGMIIVEARGDSMLPTISDGDLVMIDTADHNLTSAIWAFTYGDDVFVKRLNRLPDMIEAGSDNANLYRPFTIQGEQLNRFHLIGRVVWVGRTL